MSERPSEWSRGEVVALLQRVDLFEGLPDDDLNSIAAIVGGHTIEPGEFLFEEAEPGDAFYIVFRGAVEISKARSDGTEEKLAIRRKGDSFGEMALLNDAPRSATARAAEPTQLVSVSRDDFQELLGGDSLALRMMRALSKALRALSVRFASADRKAGQWPGRERGRVRRQPCDASGLVAPCCAQGGRARRRGRNDHRLKTGAVLRFGTGSSSRTAVPRC